MKQKTNITFARYERNGILFISILILGCILFKSYIIQYFTKPPTITKNDIIKIAQLNTQIDNAKVVYANNYKQYQNTNQYSSKDENQKIYSNNKTTYQNKYNFTIEVNAATAEDYEKLYGIGKVFAARIIKFRDGLGGFYSISQLKDVFGIEDSTFQKFKKNLTIKPVKPKKININTATFEELTVNPYFFSTVAKQIIGYRTKVKPFATAEDVKSLYFVRDHPEHYDKMLPYISVE